MSTAIDLLLFGVPSLRSPAGTVVFTMERPYQLLALLGARRDWLGRDELADWLFPDRDAASARSNLRKVLLLAGEVTGVETLERQGHLLRWTPRSDLADFESACDERRFDDAIGLGAGVFLQGFDAAFAGPALDWLLGERRRLADRWQGAARQRLAEHASQPDAALRLAGRMLARDPLDEPALAALARAHLELGEVDAAAAAIDAYARRLGDELGVAPGAAVQALAKAAATDAERQRSRPIPLEPVAPADTRFFGRRHEVNRVVDLLSRPGVRLLTLVGPGGMGKTSTARLVADRLLAAETAVVWVPLDDLTEASQVPARFAAQLGLDIAGKAEPWQRLATAIGERAVVLVADNAEHLDVAQPFERLLAATPRLRLLVTSRARLGVADELAFALEGMPLPDLDEADVDLLRNFDAVALFEARARAVSPGFDLAPQAPDVVRLLHRVEGLPLAIEQAATWTRLLPVAEIDAELAKSVDLLGSEVDAPERSARASFAQSWRLLRPVEREVLPRLALLPSAFDRDMAAATAQAPLPVLASLVDKSMLRPEPGGRFSMHTLLRQCAREHAGSEAAAVAALHADFVAGLFDEFAVPGTRISTATVARMQRDLAHVRAAWRWGVAQRDPVVLGRMVRGMSLCYEEWALWPEAIADLEAAAASLGTDRAPTTVDADVHADADADALAGVWRALAVHYHCSGRQTDAAATAQRLLDYARARGDDELAMSALNTAGLAHWERGDFEAARGHFQEALTLARRREVAIAIVAFTNNLGMVDKALGRYEEALAAYREVLRMQRGAGRPRGMVNELNNESNVLRALGRHEEALESLNEAMALIAQHRTIASRPFVMVNLGLVHDALGDRPAARGWLQRALDESVAALDDKSTLAALLSLAHFDAESGDVEAASAKAWQALTVADGLDSIERRIECLAVFGEIVATAGHVADGIALVRWAIGRRELDGLERDTHRKRLAELERRLPPGATVAELAPNASPEQALARIGARLA